MTESHAEAVAAGLLRYGVKGKGPKHMTYTQRLVNALTARGYRGEAAKTVCQAIVSARTLQYLSWGMSLTESAANAGKEWSKAAEMAALYFVS